MTTRLETWNRSARAAYEEVHEGNPDYAWESLDGAIQNLWRSVASAAASEALETIRALHQGKEVTSVFGTGQAKYMFCTSCHGQIEYPCPTIQAVQEVSP